MEFKDLLNSSIAALLDDPDTKELILEYLRSQIPDTEPEWREVWKQQSKETRTITISNENLTGRPGSKAQYLIVFRLIARYSESENIGIIETYFSKEKSSVWDFASYGVQPQNRVVFPANDYTEVILEAQRRWSEFHAEWISKTQPVEQKDQS